MTAERARAKAMARAAFADYAPPRHFRSVELAEAVAAMLDAYFANTRFVREVAGTTYRFKPEPIE